MPCSNQLLTELRNICSDMSVDVPLAPYTTFKIGGNCNAIIEPDSVVKLQEIIKLLKIHEQPFCFLGNGSNVLVADKGYDGIVILLSAKFAKVSVSSENVISCQSGRSLASLCNIAYDNSLSGLEFAFGIPATVGGAVYMNAGAYGGEMKNVIKSCTFINEENEICTLDNSQLDFSYRHSIFSGGKSCILQAEFQLISEEKSTIKARMDDYISRRKSKQPLELPSAGSTFKRPQGNYASALIEQCGLKGFTVGGAMVSQKHSGFVVNANHATCADVLMIIKMIQKIVFEKTGYSLECEIKTLGVV